MVLIAVLGLFGVLVPAVSPLTRRLGRDAGYVLAAGYLGAAVLLGTRLPTVIAGHPVEVSWRWLPALGITASLRLDSLAMVFVLLVLGVGALIMAYCPRYLEHGQRHRQIYLMLTLFTTAMLGLVLAADLLLLFVFWELTSVLSFVLIGGASHGAARPAVRALLVTSGGGVALLAAAALLAVTVGGTDLTTVLAQPQRLTGGPAWAVGALVLLAAFTKSAQAPFHFWLPNAMVAITPVSAYLHAATMVKAGIYLLMRFSSLFGGRLAWNLALLGVGLATAILGAVLALRQYDLKALLAYSTVSQLGFLVAVIGVGTPASDAAAILYTVAHALFKATLFMLVGIIDHEAGNRDLRRLSGLRHKMPVTVLLTVLAAMSMAGLPPTLGFVGKEAVFEALAGAEGMPWLAPLVTTTGVLAAGLTFAYAARLVVGIWAGPSRQPGLYEPPWTFLAPAVLASLATVGLGPGVRLLSDLVVAAAGDARPQGEAPYLAFWHGWSTAFWLSALTVLVGLLLFVLWSRLAPAREVGHPLLVRGLNRGYRSLLRLGAWTGRVAHPRSPAAYLAVPLLALVALAGAGALGLDAVPPSAGAADRPTDWALLVGLLPALAALLRVDSALAVVSLTGLVGLVMSFWFLTVGAPDVALTLMLVEVLTTVVAMLVLRHQPARLVTAPDRSARPAAVPRRSARLVGAGLAAVAVGAATAAAVTVLTGRRPPSGPAVYYLTEGKKATGGSNLVNALLVDFRALDTLGEATVLATVAVGLARLIRTHRPVTLLTGERLPVGESRGDLVLSFAQRLLTPLMVVVSVYLFLRGHYEPGGGFIAALVLGVAVALARLANPGTRPPVLARLSVPGLAGAGLLVALGAGLAVIPGGRALLTPVPLRVPGLTALPLSTGLVFDLGIYLVVLALVTAAVRQLDDEPAAVRTMRPAPKGGPR